MNRINWKIRWQNPLFYVPIIASIFMPILGYLQMDVTNLTTWAGVWEFILKVISNPYLLIMLFINIFSAANDPTVRGFNDSELSMNKVEPTHPDMPVDIKGDEVVDDNSEIVVENEEQAPPKSNAEEF